MESLYAYFLLMEIELTHFAKRKMKGQEVTIET